MTDNKQGMLKLVVAITMKEITPLDNQEVQLPNKVDGVKDYSPPAEYTASTSGNWT